MMLHFIREKAKGWIAWAIVILISIPFALWGVNSYVTPDSNPAVATVADSKITSYEFQNAVQNEQQRGNPQADEKQIKQIVLERLINNYALLNQLNENGYTVSKNSLNQQIINDSSFTDPETGRFSEQVFRQILSRAGLSVQMYRENLTKDVLIEQYLQGIQQSAIVTDTEIEQVMKLVKQKRDIAYVMIDSKPFKESIKPTEEQVSEYYESHQLEFEVPETVEFEYLLVSREELANAIFIDDESIENYYQDNRLNYTTPEERQASHILISFKADDSDDVKEKAKQQIDEIHKKLLDGGDFSALAKEFSKDPGSAANGGDLGFFKKGDMVSEFEEKAFTTAVDQFTEPFESPFGYHILKVTGTKEAVIKPLEEVKADIVKKLQFDEAEKPYYEKTEALETIAYEQPDSLEPASIEAGIGVKKSPFISRQGGEGIFANPKFLAKAFHEQVLETGNNSEMIDLGNDQAIVVRVSERVPASIKPMESVSESIRKTLIQQMAEEKALALAEQIEKAFNAGEAIDTLLQDNKLEKIEKGLVERSDRQIPFAINQKAFSMPRVTDKPIAASVKISAQQAAMVIVKAVEDGKNEDQAYAQNIRGLLERARGQLYGNLSVMQARAEATVEIDKTRAFGEEE